MAEKLQVWSCGGGTQSCAIAALIVQGKLPKPYLSVIADTGFETAATWEYMDNVLSPQLKSVGVELYRVGGSQWSTCFLKLFWKEKDEPLIPVYSTETGKPVKLRNICTSEWKIKPINRWLSERGLPMSKRITWIGFSADEPLRWMKMANTDEYKKGWIRLPLVNDVRLKRYQAIALVESMGWPTPPRSACWMCPNRSDHEWRKLLLERPDEFKKAVALEKKIQERDPDAWLHRSCVPLDQLDFSQPEDLFSRPCDSGQCFV